MVETRKLVDPFNQAFMQIAKLSPDPELQKPKTAVALEPVQREFKTDYALPDEIVQILTNAFQQLGLELELMETDDTSVGEKFQHHKVKTATGEVVLIYCEERFIQVSDSFFAVQLNSLGTLFSGDYNYFYIFSHAGTPAFRYEELLRQLTEDKKFFAKARFFLNNAIEEFKNPNNAASFLKGWFDSSEQAGVHEKKESSFDMVKLGELIKKYFIISELQSLCVDLNIEALNYENLEGDTLNGKVEALIGHAKRHGYLPKLLEYCKTKRDHVSALWDEVEG